MASGLIRLIALTGCAALAGSGCSFVMMNNPPPPPVKSQPRCESGVVVPVIDAIGALATVVVGSAALIAVSSEDFPTTTRLGIAGISLGLGATLVTSSVIGFRRAKRCDRAIEALHAGATSARL